MSEYTIVKDYSKDELFDEMGLRRLKDSYMTESEKSPQDRFAFVASAFASNQAHAERLYKLLSNHFLSASTPILSYGTSKKGLPISCYLAYIDDSAQGLVNAMSEAAWLSVSGGGVGLGIGIRSEDDKSVGVMPHLKTYEAISLAYRQGKCYHPSVEVLTEAGFLPFDVAAKNDLKVLQVGEDGSSDFVKPIEWVEQDSDGYLMRFYDSKNIDIAVTGNHRMFFKRRGNFDKNFEIRRAKDLPMHRDVSFINSISTLKGEETLSYEERLLIAFQADGSYLYDKDRKNKVACEFHFFKERKVQHLIEILDKLEINYTKYNPADGSTRFYIKYIPVSKSLDWVEISSKSSKWALQFLEEVSKWDSYIRPLTKACRKRFVYSSTNLSAADVVQAVASIAGYKSRLTATERDETRQIMYTCYLSEKDNFGLERLNLEVVDYVGKVYCAVVPKGGLVVRSNGHTLVCGNTRRGSFAAYLGIGHPNVMQFIDMRKPTGDANQRCQELHHGINITDDFMEIIENCMKDPDYDDSWDLIDPHTKIVKEVVSARQLWESILETRMRTGEPYLHFIDESNRRLPEYQKKLGLEVKQSNICTEITLATDTERTAVCCLASLNLEYWDEWKDDYQTYRDVAEMLDNALSIFIRDASRDIKRAAFSAYRERAIGVGALGFHALLQQKGLPFESALASSINYQIFKRYQLYLDKASGELALERGECPDGIGNGVRFSHTRSIAPNASSSIIMGNTSPSIEPFRGNAYRQDTLSGSFLNKNKYLDKILMEKGITGDEYNNIWSSVVTSAGSVQHLTCLTDNEKDIFKTASELDQNWIIQHAADRQTYIDQAQSINLFFKANASIDYLHHVHFMAWKKKLKTLYYCRSDKLYHGDSMDAKVERVTMESSKVPFLKTTEEECLACQ